MFTEPKKYQKEDVTISTLGMDYIHNNPNVEHK